MLYAWYASSSEAVFYAGGVSALDIDRSKI